MTKADDRLYQEVREMRKEMRDGFSAIQERDRIQGEAIAILMERTNTHTNEICTTRTELDGLKREGRIWSGINSLAVLVLGALGFPVAR